MTAAVSGARETLTRELIDRGFWIETGVQGVYGRDARFESIVERVDALVVGLADGDGAEKLYFPPVMNRDWLVQSDYVASFPELCGSVQCFRGGHDEHDAFVHDVADGRPWGPHLQDTELALTPAACYPVYPTLRGTLPESGRLINLSSYILRREPSSDPARLQIFRQRENIRVGRQREVEAWRALWMERGMQTLQSLGLPGELVVAADPFFGRGGKLLSSNQRNDKRKFEIVCPITSESEPTALASFNYHGTKFGTAFEIRCADGGDAHTACFGFGLERVALALLRTHGFETDEWPEDVRTALGC